MTFSILSILIAVLLIVIGTSYFKIHPFLVLLFATLILAFFNGFNPSQIIFIITSGFGKIIQNIGLLILFGTIIGSSMEKTNATKYSVFLNGQVTQRKRSIRSLIPR